MKFSEFLFGKPDKLKQIPTGTQEQRGLHNSIIGQAMGMQQPGGGYDQAQNYFNQFLGDDQQQAYDQFSSPYLQQFQEQILPMIMERFAGGGALSSSGFGQALGGAGAGLQSQLAQLFSQLQGNAAQQQYGQYNQLAQTGLDYQPFAYNKQQGSSGFLGNLLGGIGGSMGGPLGTALGEGITGGISSLFKRNNGRGMGAGLQGSMGGGLF